MIRFALAASFLFLMLPFSAEAATVEFCGEGNSCICITWSRASGDYIEVRCPHVNGWTNNRASWNDATGTLVNEDGSWGGNGTMQDPTSGELEGSTVSGLLSIKVIDAIAKAGELLQEPKCRKLFDGAPLTTNPTNLILENMIKRNGEGVEGPGGVTPCDSSSIKVWTTCCSHTPVLYFCNSFSSVNALQAGRLIIHEALHVAGQRENSSASAGPNDPPNPSGINSAVSKACSS